MILRRQLLRRLVYGSKKYRQDTAHLTLLISLEGGMVQAITLTNGQRCSATMPTNGLKKTEDLLVLMGNASES